MKRYLTLGVLVFSIGCDSEPPLFPSQPPQVFTPAPTPRPTPATLAGFWKVANPNSSNDIFNEYGIEFSEDRERPGRITGRSVFPARNLTGFLDGRVEASGRVVWQTRYRDSDTDNGDMTLSANRTTMRGTVRFDLPSLGGSITYTDVVLAKQP
jgi:hypothetical protein